MADAVEALPVVTMAAQDGFCIGGGVEFQKDKLSAMGNPIVNILQCTGGAESFINIKEQFDVISEAKDMHDKVEANSTIEGGCWGCSLSVSASMAKTMKSTETSTTVFASIVGTTSRRRLDILKCQLSENAKKTIEKGEFQKHFGRYCVAEVRVGIQLVSLLTAKASSKEEANKVAAKVKAGAWGVSVEGGVAAENAQGEEKSSVSATTDYKGFQAPVEAADTQQGVKLHYIQAKHAIAAGTPNHPISVVLIPWPAFPCISEAMLEHYNPYTAPEIHIKTAGSVGMLGAMFLDMVTTFMASDAFDVRHRAEVDGFMEENAQIRMLVGEFQDRPDDVKERELAVSKVLVSMFCLHKRLKKFIASSKAKKRRIGLEGQFYLRNVASTKYLSSNGSSVCVSQKSPQSVWELHSTGNHKDIVHVATQKYLDTHGKEVKLWRDGPLSNKGIAPDNITWTFERLAGSSDIYYIINVGHQKYLDTHGGPVTVWRDGNLHNQGQCPRQIQWQLIPVQQGL